jgi:sodium/bile acid cotransporter 7
VVLPLMLFHQMQLMVCAVIAKRWAREGTDTVREPARTPVPAGGPAPGHAPAPASGTGKGTGT